MDTSGRSSNSRCSGSSAGNIDEIVEQTMEDEIEETLNDDHQRIAGDLDKQNEVDLNKLEDLMYEGMVFESEEKAFDRYSEVARRAGFSVRRDKLVKRANGTMRKRVFVCFKQGIRKKDNRYQYVRKERPQIRTGCMARMVIKYENENKWVVTDIIYEHNHPLPTTSKSYRLRPQRRIAEAPIAEVENLHAVGTFPDGSQKIIRQQLDRHESLGNKQVANGNHIQNKGKKLGKADVRALLDYFTRKKMENPAFFYSMIVDKENQVTNVFWADARSIMDYSYFGDVVIFDTAYRTNVNGWPFAPFVGVNHHKQTILFGGALILDESTKSFIWLFGTWLKTMSGQKPKTILTDQCLTVSKAISTVMPEAQHRFCVWHVLENASKHLCHVYWISGFLHDFNKCIYGYETEEEFISAWEKMLHDYKLVGTKWLDDLFDARQKWALIYGRDTFCADTATTQHNKCINKFLKKFVKRKYTSTEFLARYERALGSWRERELHEDFLSIQTTPNLLFPAPMLKQAAEKYTRAAFEMFADEYKEWILCKVEDLCADGICYKYEVTQEKQSKGLVTINPSSCQVVCSCKRFEFVGILCRHIMKVLYHRNIHDLPVQYVLKRWSKDAKLGVVRDREGNPIQNDCNSLMFLRYNELFQKAVEIAKKGALTQHVYSVATRAMDNAMAEVEAASKVTEIGLEDGLQTTLVTRSHHTPVSFGERVAVAEGSEGSGLFSGRLTTCMDIGQRKKSRNDIVESSSDPNMSDLRQETVQNHIVLATAKSNGSLIQPSIQLNAAPNSVPMSESMQFFYPIMRPNLPYIPSPYTQGSSIPGIESYPFTTNNIPEAHFVSSKPQFLANMHTQPTFPNTGFKSHQVSYGESRVPAIYQHSSMPPRFESGQLSPHGALEHSTYMDLRTTPGALGINSSEESSDSDESQFSPLGN